MFSVRFRVCVRVYVYLRRRHRCNDFCFSRQNHLSLGLDIWDKESIGLGNVLDDLWVTLTQGHGCDIDKQKFAYLQDKVRTTQPITTKLGRYITLVMVITWWDSEGQFCQNPSYCQISDVFFQGQTLYWTDLRNGWSDWCETKRRCNGWILGELCDLDLWPHPWPWPLIFQGQISK